MKALAHEVILASAGTGKTFNLSNRFIAILMRDQGLDPARILAATFTRKAAGEIFDRVIQRVTEAAFHSDKARELSMAIGLDSDVGSPGYRELCVRLARSFHRLGISTIDAFVARIATCIGAEIGLPHGWRICEDDEDAALRSLAADTMLDRAQPDQLWELFKLWYAGGFGRDPHNTLISIAGALHGAYVESDGRESPWRSVKAPELVDEQTVSKAIEQLRRSRIVSLKGGTEIKKLPESISHISAHWKAEEWEEILKTTVISNCMGGDNTYGRAEFAAEFGDCFRTIGTAAARRALADLSQRNRAAYGLTRGFDEAYTELKDARSLFRFDDIPRRILGANFEEQLIHLYFRLDSEIKHVLLDEFQDTSVLQFRLFEPIISEILDQHDPERSFFCVGDVKQSLYSWRGARSELLAGLGTRWESIQQSTLERSWRSAPVVLDFVNAVFENIGDRWRRKFENDGSEIAAQVWESRWKPHQSAKGEYSGRVNVVRVCPGDPSRSVKQVVSDCVVEKVRELHERNPHATIAILVRRNALIQHYIYELEKLGIKASGDGKSCLTDAGCVSAAASLFHLADHPDDTASFVHVASGPFASVFGITEVPVSKDRLREASLQLSRAWRTKVASEGLANCVTFLLKSVAGEMDTRSFMRFEQLVGMAVTAQARRENGPGKFAAMIRTLGVEDEQPARVRVMTIHQSKGLEFNCVVIAELVTRGGNNSIRVLTDRVSDRGERDFAGPISDISICPPKDVIPHDEGLEKMSRYRASEEAMSDLCVLYVAMTRATHSLDIFVEGVKGKEETLSGIGSLVLDAFGADRQGVGVETIHEHEQPNWQDTIKPPKSNARPVTEIEVSKPKVSQSVHPLRWQRKSPSSFEGGPERPLSEVLTIHSQAGRHRGSVIHKFCELIEWSDCDGVPTQEALISAAVGMGLDHSELKREAEGFLISVKGLVSNALARSRYPSGADVKLRREWSFAVPMNDDGGEMSILNGSVDRLVTISELGKVVRAEIIDFKTDRVSDPASDEFKKRVEHYKPQMEAYRSAVAKVFRIPEQAIAVTLVMLEAGTTVAV